MPDDNYDEEASHLREQTPPLPDIDDPYENLFQLDLDFEAAHEKSPEIDEENNVAISSRDCDELLQFSHDTSGSTPFGIYENHAHNLPTTSLPRNYQLSNPPRITLQPPTPINTPAPTSTQLSLTSPAQANSSPTPTPSSVPLHRCHCGYIPTGEEKWKASNLRRHKRIQHATESKVYLCRWRGCKSSFTRSDNLRCHVREKGHFDGLGGGVGSGSGVGGAEMGGDEDGNGEGKERRKKRRKVDEGVERGGATR
ncbi:hypothetical protein VTL71DRAFT_15415 [Oculimacula yallundae]|uniref:C2H2-type domain-containing protein n=1 Tax=Oculimacula yallundae TaxID=86028 RepID=A0ABR4CHU2_9HELO